MTCKRQFLLHGKDSHPDAAILFDRCVTRKDERRLRQVHFAGYRLHLIIAESSAIRKDGERIALKRIRGEDIKLRERKSTGIGGRCSHAALDCASLQKGANSAALHRTLGVI